MGQRGPVGMRDDQLARPRERKGGDQQETIKGTLKPVTIPEPDPEWHPIARMLWDSALESGQSDFYQSTDWAFLYSLCEDLTRYKEPLVNQKTGELYYKRSGQMLATIYSAMGSLLITEGDRRRVRMELVEPAGDESSAALLAIDDYRDRLGAPSTDD